MTDDLRTSIWEGMVHTDRLRRYYGRLAGRLSRLDRWVAVATSGLALSTVALAFQEHGLVLTSAVLTAIVGSLPLVFRLGDQVTDAAYCAKRLADLAIKWQELWQKLDRMDEEELSSRWKQLDTELNDITALKERVPEHRRLRKKTQKEAYAYWTQKATQATKQTAIARA